MHRMEADEDLRTTRVIDDQLDEYDAASTFNNDTTEHSVPSRMKNDEGLTNTANKSGDASTSEMDLRTTPLDMYSETNKDVATDWESQSLNENNYDQSTTEINSEAETPSSHFTTSLPQNIETESSPSHSTTDLPQNIKTNSSPSHSTTDPQNIKTNSSPSHSTTDLQNITTPSPQSLMFTDVEPRQSEGSITSISFDRAFLYAVRHNPTGLIIYMGRYLHPT